MALEDIGEGNDTALLCMTNFTACCKHPYTGGSWFYPNGSEVLSNGTNEDFYRTRGQIVVRLHHRRGEVAGIYHCVIPISMNVTQTIYIGVYRANTGEWYNYWGEPEASPKLAGLHCGSVFVTYIRTCLLAAI